MTDKCACGRPLHYSDPDLQAYVEDEIRRLGACVPIITPQGCWLVPRHYIALHGVKAADLPSLGFAKASS